MKKKFLAIAMAAVMAFSAAPALPVNTTVAEAADTTVINIDKQIGADDLTSPFWSEFSDHYKIEDGKSYEFNFDVYGGAANWNNYCMVFTNEAATVDAEKTEAYKEFSVVRTDNWGWGGGDNTCLSGDPIVYSNSINEAGMTDDDWATFRDIMTKATVSLKVTRDGKTINTVANICGKEDASKAFVYKTTSIAAYEDGTAATDVYMTLVVDGSMIKPSVEEKVTVTDISEVVGAEDNSAAFWSAFSKQYKIESDKTYTFEFENHGDGVNYWDNYIMIFTNEAAYNGQGQSDNYFEYAVIRADNWGWGGGDNLSHNGDEIVKGGTIADIIGDQAAFTEIIKDSNVSLTISRKDALVSTEAVVTSIADPSKSYTYTAVFNMDTADGELYFGMTLEKAHLVMKTMTVKELTATMPESPEQGEVAPPQGTKKQIMLSGVSAKFGAKTVSGTVNAPDATVTVQVNKTDAVKATVTDKKFSATLKNKLKGGDKVKITVTAEGYYDKEQTVTVKDTSLKVKKVTAKKNAKKITGTVTVKKATVKVKVGKKAYKKAKVSGKNFTLKVAKLKKGTKVTVKATKTNYVTATKSVKVK